MNDKWEKAAAKAEELAAANSEPTPAVTRVTDGLPDTCPEDGCDRRTHIRRFPKTHAMPKANPEAPRAEAHCPRDGIVGRQR